MPEVNIQEKIYEKIKKIAKFFGWTIEQVVEHFLNAEIELIDSEPTLILEHYLDEKRVLELIYGSD